MENVGCWLFCVDVIGIRIVMYSDVVKFDCVVKDGVW